MRGVFQAAERKFTAWRNGGGETAEIAVSPAGADFETFDWRISTAIVASDGPFSSFPNVDRVLTVIEGGPMRLSVGGEVHELEAASPPLAFAGDQPCEAQLLGGPLLDFNVMIRRPLRAEVTRGPFTLPPPGAVARLALLMEPAAGLNPLDLVDLDACEPSLLQALEGAAVLTVSIWPLGL
ncbi:HutD family protein [Xinfangfangia sp. CPCC 101601]|uniref:HutD family protein n=1 Tax=Pseudogemmobacter lacusdianii TaxID=3069608 RepID=A0ABU0VWE7_9RHOB|nr:HutD family protein [Xinfangfangia sp. CPCC 101601]MDQ2066033.1 HutD family protein [Xinfangfangia sp. CPCC 101601]